MGYEVHITRAIPSLYFQRFPVTAAEVLDGVRQAADLDVPTNPGPSSEIFPITVGKDDWLLFSHGELRTKHPSEQLIRRMLALAATLDAWVLGDDEHIYAEENGQIVARPAVLTDLPYPTYFIARHDKISASEWEGVVGTQSDFAWWTRVEARVPSGLKWIGSPPVACWTGHPAGKPVPFFFDEYDRGIEVLQPDSATLTRMRVLAPRLDAEVLRDPP
ncbi:hypothetical protein AB0M36_30445 [Actinoplanes sp. NPDC051346]|uniref:hypothetical protein n=1 Tax=Actinoplanes sp. NPDC051346 TaxID=3155048 RepID=UPI00341776D2